MSDIYVHKSMLIYVHYIILQSDDDVFMNIEIAINHLKNVI